MCVNLDAKKVRFGFGDERKSEGLKRNMSDDFDAYGARFAISEENEITSEDLEDWDPRERIDLTNERQCWRATKVFMKNFDSIMLDRLNEMNSDSENEMNNNNSQPNTNPNISRQTSYSQSQSDTMGTESDHGNILNPNNQKLNIIEKESNLKIKISNAPPKKAHTITITPVMEGEEEENMSVENEINTNEMNENENEKEKEKQKNELGNYGSTSVSVSVSFERGGDAYLNSIAKSKTLGASQGLGVGLNLGSLDATQSVPGGKKRKKMKRQVSLLLGGGLFFFTLFLFWFDLFV